jgi:hypothetical protein
MPDLSARQRRQPHPYMLAVCFGLLLTSIAACTSHTERVELTTLPSTSLLPAPIVVESLRATPDQPDQNVSNELSTTETKVIDGVDENVKRAISKATLAVGIETSYLIVVAARESSFDPRKRARRTSAMGLYQFTADTWLRAVRAFGERHGLGEYASQIAVGRDGKISMRNATARVKVLRLRADPEISALMAAELAQDNQARLEQTLGRPVTPAEIYLAHLLGVTHAARLIETAHSAPHTPGVRLLPAAARSNPDLFKPLGRVASAHAIVEKLKIHYERQEARFSGHVSTNSIHTPTDAAPRSLSGSTPANVNPIASLAISLASVAP